MNAAVFEIEGWIGTHRYAFTGADAQEITRGLEDIQDLSCLADMGRSREGAKGQQELDRLEDFLMKYERGALEMDDLAQFYVQLSIGYIKCVDIAVGDEQVEQLRAKYPKALWS